MPKSSMALMRQRNITLQKHASLLAVKTGIITVRQIHCSIDIIVNLLYTYGYAHKPISTDFRGVRAR